MGTDWGIPSDCQLVRFGYEIYESCGTLYPPTCIGSAASNFSPVVDNVRIRMTTARHLPVSLVPQGVK